MPDANNMPLAADVINKANTVKTFDPDVDEVTAILDSVIEEFSVATKREWTPITETRYFDGNGQAELIIPEIVPDTTFAVHNLGYTYSADSMILKTNYRNSGYNILTRKYGFGFDYFNGIGGFFPIGRQNISITATWGFAATMPADVYQAIVSETAARLVMQTMGLSGISTDIQTESTRVRKGYSPIDATLNPVSMWHQNYLNTIEKRKSTDVWKTKLMAPRIV